MNNFEHIDDYLTNRLNTEEKATFEKQLEADGALRADVEFQKLTIEAIKQARVTQLKAMLNNVPVGGGVSTGLTAAKIAGGVVSVALIGSIAYFSLRDSKTSASESTALKTEKTIKPFTPETIPSDSTPDSIAGVGSSKSEEKQVAPVPSQTGEVNAQDQPAAAFKEPKIDVLDLSEELASDNVKKEKPLIENSRSEITPSRVEVSTDSSNKKYSFHYQFSNGKLMLYGSFDKGLYEILEINGNSHNVFLFYESNYYLLEEKENTTSPLMAVKDPVLLRKLKEYRSR